MPFHSRDTLGEEGVRERETETERDEERQRLEAILSERQEPYPNCSSWSDKRGAAFRNCIAASRSKEEGLWQQCPRHSYQCFKRSPFAEIPSWQPPGGQDGKRGAVVRVEGRRGLSFRTQLSRWRKSATKEGRPPATWDPFSMEGCCYDAILTPGFSACRTPRREPAAARSHSCTVWF